MSGPPTRLRKAIRLRNAVALYASSVLGSGVLVLPGLTAQIAGPGSLLAWILLSFASVPFAITFASLSARRPESGGVYSFAKEAFGLRVATVAGWLFVLWELTGAPAVALIAASYVQYAFGLTRAETFAIAGAIVLGAFAINYRGIVFSNRVQLAIIASIVALLLLAVAASSVFVKPENFVPFLPNGWGAVGTAAALIFWSFLGYENVSNVAEEFENPEKDFRRSVLLSVILVSVLYVSVAIVTIGSLAYRAGGDVAPFSALLGKVFGTFGAAGTALFAVVIIFGLINAYTTGFSRVLYAAARDGALPTSLAHVSRKTSAPDRILIVMFGSLVPMFVLFYVLNVSLETALLASSGAAISVYVIGFASGIKIFSAQADRRNRVFAGISIVISLFVMPFVGPLLAVAFAVAAAALAFAIFVPRDART